LNLGTREWEALSEDAFARIFKGSPIKRAKYKGIKRNLSFINTAE
ncbi:MAG: tRNA epoxyqueuosine(34) reductase QueG, partial [Chitinophagaceae bacterium]|nr:tRNA epoxyqueuosine(34) reductase QueG [Chitinophagaceae bacterium]